jgi:predicted RNA-binding Zn ribbon-like protein
MYFSTDQVVLDPVLSHRPPVTECTATRRFRLRPAASGLALVQDFLNTGAQPGRRPDLLADTARAVDWSHRAARAWSAERGIEAQAPELSDSDLGRLRELRRAVRAMLTGETSCLIGDLGSAAFVPSFDGGLRWRPTGQGWRWWSAAVCSEILLSEQGATWRRLKQCRNPLCNVAFYDRSWDNSGVWHASGCADTPGTSVDGGRHAGEQP